MLFELLAGWTPFGGGHPGAVLRRHVTDKVPPLPGVPGPLAALVASCLAKGPAARLTAAEFAARLRELAPLLEDMPPLDIPDPREGGWDVRSSARASLHGGRNPTIDPIPMRHSGIVPLVHNAEVKDEDEDTHLNLMRPIRERDQGDVRRRSGTGRTTSAELRAERASAAAVGSGSKRPRWIAATAAALLVGGAAAAIAMGMSGGDDPEQGQQGALAEGRPDRRPPPLSSPPGTTTRSTAVGLSFQPAHGTATGTGSGPGRAADGGLQGRLPGRRRSSCSSPVPTAACGTCRGRTVTPGCRCDGLKTEYRARCRRD